jgi:hypothetical protein
MSCDRLEVCFRGCEGARRSIAGISWKFGRMLYIMSGRKYSAATDARAEAVQFESSAVPGRGRVVSTLQAGQVANLHE